MKTATRIAWLLAISLLAPLAAAANESTVADGYVIHHNAFTADVLDPVVAQRYGIQRSKQRGVINVTLIKEKPGTTGMPTAARVEVSAASLTGQTMRVPMRELKEQEAVYYIGEFPVKDQETVEFTIEVTPNGTAKGLTAKTSHQFFTR
jgi:hypothetical protein